MYRYLHFIEGTATRKHLCEIKVDKYVGSTLLPSSFGQGLAFDNGRAEPHITKAVAVALKKRPHAFLSQATE